MGAGEAWGCIADPMGVRELPFLHWAVPVEGVGRAWF